jgi:amino acid transporter
MTEQSSDDQQPSTADDAQPGHNGASGDEERTLRLPRRGAEPPEIESTEVLRGAKPGTRYARRVRERERRFARSEEGTFRALERATAPRTGPARFWRSIRRVAVGAPIASTEAEEQRLPKLKALAVFSSDALSSSAYATDEILLVLVAAGTGALAASIPIALAIGALLGIVAFSYRQTIRAYPSGGGSYIVARENLGDLAGLSAAAALSVDYILTVAVSVAAGVFAITSAAPELNHLAVEMSVAFVAIITLLNLRGLRESGTIFAIPTYAFIVGFIVLLAGGFIRMALDPSLHATEPASGWHPAGAATLSWFLVLRAFASGSAALTAVEAISNGIPAFKKPESRNASITLMWMVAILAVFFIGLTILAHQFGVRHADEVSAPAQIARVVYGHTPIFYYIQTATALILILAANTSYADFPRLSSILARDRFLPHQFTFRGDRLAFSNGIILLGVVASGLLIIFDADVDRLIPLYAFGVFVSFTLSQAGMVVHHRRIKEPAWKRSLVMNATGAVATAVVAVIIGATKFNEGAWISMIAMCVLGVTFYSIHRHYQGVERKIRVRAEHLVAPSQRRQVVLIPVDEINRAVLHTVDFARRISPNVRAIHVTDDRKQAQALRDEWNARVFDVPLILIDSPYRSFVAPVLSYIDALDEAERGEYVIVVLPEFVTAWPWQRWLHNQSARRLKNALRDAPNTVVVEVPYHLAAVPDAYES